jgi:hypothetical protein
LLLLLVSLFSLLPLPLLSLLLSLPLLSLPLLSLLPLPLAAEPASNEDDPVSSSSLKYTQRMLPSLCKLAPKDILGEAHDAANTAACKDDCGGVSRPSDPALRAALRAASSSEE